MAQPFALTNIPRGRGDPYATGTNFKGPMDKSLPPGIPNPIRAEGGEEPILAIDVGSGTQDILLYDPAKTMENCVKLILPSQTQIVAHRIQQATQSGKPICLTGNLMGGGPCVAAVRRHLQAGLAVFATEPAAGTLHDNPDRVREMGVVIVDEPPPGTLPIRMGDVDMPALRSSLARFDVDLPERYAVAVQDHGHSPTGSNRKFRFAHLRRFVQGGGDIASLIYASPPPYMTRMLAVQRDLPGALVMDTGSAAVWGALCDPVVREGSDRGVIIVNVGNQHALGVLVKEERIWGLFEDHTHIVTGRRLLEYVSKLREGTLSDEEVFGGGGHGCYIHPEYDPKEWGGLIAVTGPNRHILKRAGFYFPTPYGDMMLTGCFGLVAAAMSTQKISASRRSLKL
ncbi:MAG: DUF1786 domain-containing protein [bacterium]